MTTLDYRINPDKTLHQNLREISGLCKDADTFTLFNKKYFLDIFGTTEFIISKKGDKLTELYISTVGYLKKDNLKDTDKLYQNFIYPFKDLRGDIPEFDFRTDNPDKYFFKEYDHFLIRSREIETPKDKKKCLADFYQKFRVKPHKLLLPKKESTGTNQFKSIELADLFAKTYKESGYTGLRMKNNKTELAIFVDKNVSLILDIKYPTRHDINALEKMFNSNSTKPFNKFRKWTVRHC